MDASNIDLTLSVVTLAGLIFSAGGGWYMLYDLRTRVNSLISRQREDHDRSIRHESRITLLERQQSSNDQAAKMH